MTKKSFGKMVPVDLRDYWQKEEQDFTPWLAKDENIAQLGEVLGLNLEIEGKEESVGPFRADILCRETGSGHYVLIENQLEKTDHTHLGQIITYAAGLEAVVIVWIARHFTEEHRAAIDWLNNVTNESTSFFGLEIELWRIADSPPAPKYNVVCKPNDWRKNIAARREGLSKAKQLQLDFWTSFSEYLSNNGIKRVPKPQPQSWVIHPLGRRGFYITTNASMWDTVERRYSPELRVDFVIDNEHSKDFYGLLEQQKEEIQKEIGLTLTWHTTDNARTCRIYVRRSADLYNRADWPNQMEWLCSHLIQFQQTFGSRVKALSLDDVEKPV